MNVLMHIFVAFTKWRLREFMGQFPKMGAAVVNKLMHGSDVDTANNNNDNNKGPNTTARAMSLLHPLCSTTPKPGPMPTNQAS
jgi:hypothetical protein